MQLSDYMALSMIHDLLYDLFQQMVDERRCLTLENVDCQTNYMSCFSAQFSNFPKTIFSYNNLKNRVDRCNHHKKYTLEIKKIEFFRPTCMFNVL